MEIAMPHSPFFSICIPAYKRPEDVCRAIRSCLIQDEYLFEILIGDDTPNNTVEDAIKGTFGDESRIRYSRNNPSLGQALNVNQLFHLTRGEWIVLLHDDDYLEPFALATFSEDIRKYPEGDFFYGNQHLEMASGKCVLEQSEAYNAGYGRIPGNKGLITNPAGAVLQCQIPNDGFCVRAALAKQLGYPGLPDAGDACDWAFAAKLVLTGSTFVYSNAYVSTYVETADSIWRNNPKNDATLRSMKLAYQHFPNERATPAFLGFFITHIGGAVSKALRLGEEQFAWDLVKMAWKDRRVSRFIVLRQFVKYILVSKNIANGSR